MANPDAPFGLRPVRHLLGGPILARRYYVPSTDANNIFIGDPVTRAGSSDTDAECPTVTIATVGNGNVISGVMVGAEPDQNYTTMYRAASTNRYIYVVDDPFVVFHIRDDGVAALAATTVSLNAVLISTHSGSTATGLSKMELDTNTDAPAGDSSNQLYIIQKAKIPNNEVGANAIWEVLINLHTFRASAGADAMLGV